MKKVCSLLIIGVVFLMAQILVSAAAVPYTTYTYNQWHSPVDSPPGYKPGHSIDGILLGTGRFNNPQDIFADTDNTLYILDTGNNRVVYVDNETGEVKILEKFKLNDKEYLLNEPHGIFVSEDKVMYIADSNNKRLIKCTMDGEITQVFERPKSEQFPSNEEFIPLKVAVNSSGIVHVLCKGIFNGAVMYSSDGEFLGFFGSNKVEITPKLLFDRFLKSFMSAAQKEKLPAYIPTEYSNLLYDNDDFLYTCTVSAFSQTSLIRKLNPSGVNILETKADTSFQKGFGDFGLTLGNKLQRTQIIDITVDKKGFISAVDFSLGKIFQYDQDANLLFAFSGLGDKEGLFLSPVAIESIGDELIVLDNKSGRITFFELTEYGNIIRESLAMYNEGLYLESVGLWKTVLRLNSNCNLAYIGLGKANLEMGEYEEAMRNFKIGHYDYGYNRAFTLFRKAGTRSNFLVLFIPVLILIIAIFVYDLEITRKTAKKVKNGIKKMLDRIFTKIIKNGKVN